MNRLRLLWYLTYFCQKCYFIVLRFFFLNYWLMIFWILEVIAQVFNPTTELAMALGKPTKEAKAEIETHKVTAEAKISNRSI